MSQKHVVTGLVLRGGADNHPVLASYKAAADTLLPKALTIFMRDMMKKKMGMGKTIKAARRAKLLKAEQHVAIADLIYSERYYGLLSKGSTALTVRK